MIPFVGPSYALDFRKADVQRSVNWYPALIESGTGKSLAMLAEVPGLQVFATLGAPVRGAWEVAGRLFAVAGSALYEVSSAGVPTFRGALNTSSGVVEADHGLFQLVLVDGPCGYVLNLQTNAFQQITSPAFYGSKSVAFLDGVFYFVRPDTQQFYWSAIDDATDLSGLDFASAERSPDNIVRLIVSFGEALILGEKSGEVWSPRGDPESPLERNNGALIEVGCAAPASVRKLDNTVIWVGNDANGSGVVWMLEGYKPVPISDRPREELLAKSTDLSGAVAYTEQYEGHRFYCLRVPGLDTTHVFDLKTRQWHERAELVNGEYTQHRATCHAYAFGKHIVGADDGKLYVYVKTGNNAGDVKVRDRISPHMAVPSLEFLPFNTFELDAQVGEGKPDGTEAKVLLRYSNNGGATWSAWREASLGSVGQLEKRVIWRRLGRAKDRVWHVRVTDDAPCSLIQAKVS